MSYGYYPYASLDPSSGIYNASICNQNCYTCGSINSSGCNSFAMSQPQRFQAHKNYADVAFQSIDPLFHQRTVSEDEKLLTDNMVKLARRSGALNLSGRGLANVPPKVYEINEREKDISDKLVKLTVREEDAWWNQKPLNSLDLSSNSLCSLSPRIENLNSLTVLLLQNNGLTEIPREISKLEKLQRINLSRNQLLDLPNEFFTLPDLRYLNVAHNLIEELNPDVSDLHMLEHLDVSHNHLISLPGGIGFLVRLKELIAAHNRIKELPRDIVDLRNLQTLDLLHNDLSALPEEMGGLRKLMFLYVQHNDIHCIPDFEGCQELQELHMANNFISEIPKEFCTQLPHLKIFDLRDNKIEVIPEEICLLQNLVRLDISNNSITQLPVTLAQLAHLINLQVEGNPIKSLRRNIIQRGTSRILKTLRERAGDETPSETSIKGAEGAKARLSGANDAMFGNNAQFPDKDANQLNQNYVMSDEKIWLTPCFRRNYYSRDQNYYQPTEGFYVPPVDNEWLFTLRKTHCLNITCQDLTDVPIHVFELAAEENANLVDCSKNRLTTLPDGLLAMRYCATELIFSKNLIHHVPQFICQFTRLSLLNLSCNNLKSLPMKLSYLNTLRELNICNNQFDEVPRSVYGLPGLEVLLASDNRIKLIDASSQGLGALKRLAILDLRNNEISEVPPILGNLEQISKLEIQGNPFRNPRYQILEKGTEAVMSYLRDRIPQ